MKDIRVSIDFVGGTARITVEAVKNIVGSEATMHPVVVPGAEVEFTYKGERRRCSVEPEVKRDEQGNLLYFKGRDLDKDAFRTFSVVNIQGAIREIS